MRDRFTRRMLALAALVPVLLAAISASQVSRFRCQMSGLVLESHCCPDADSDAPRTATVSASECCDHEVLDFARPPSELAGRAGSDVALAAPVVLPVLSPSLATSIALRLATAPPPPAGSLVLLKRALLI